MVCTVSVCVMCCCQAAFCTLGSNAHSTPAATEQLEIIVLALDVFTDISPLASLQRLPHTMLLCYVQIHLISACKIKHI